MVTFTEIIYANRAEDFESFSAIRESFHTRHSRWAFALRRGFSAFFKTRRSKLDIKNVGNLGPKSVILLIFGETQKAFVLLQF